ncbi:alpha/beta fold hydrolase [Streptomyces goshikiensis]|uniref:alpha/beta fold hydrolase n=1 Tax=Streptomyces goshikiensis TaxID=1942 RepID=UPI002E1200F8|nr:alpha/beta hydrolase [Streptomyces goshikiensis]
MAGPERTNHGDRQRSADPPRHCRHRADHGGLRAGYELQRRRIPSPGHRLVAAGHRLVLPDVPGQPGLSSEERGISGGRLSWSGTWLSEVLDAAAVTGPVVVVGHSFGAAIALSCPSPRIDRLVLVSPGGLGRLRLTPGLLGVSASWFVRATPARSTRLLQAMLAPGHQPREELVESMTLVARHSRSSGAPGVADLPARAVPRLVTTGAHDTFLPPRRLAPAVRTMLGTDLHVIPDAGHLVIEEHPGRLADLV